MSEADCKRPSNRVHVEAVTQSTPNVQNNSSCPVTEVSDLKTNSVGREQQVDKGIQNKCNVSQSSQSCDNNCDILKSRRYSSSDVYLSRARQPWQSHVRSQLGAFGATAAALQQLQISCQESSDSRCTHSQLDVTDYCTKVQKTLDILSPKLSKPRDWQGITNVQSTDSIQTGSSSCGLDLESHGHSSQGYTSNSSLNLSEILQSCSLFSSEDKLSEAVSDTAADVKYLKSLSSGSSTTSTRELFETPTVSCSIGSLSDLYHQRNLHCKHLKHATKHRRCRNCNLSNSVANLSAASLSSPTTDNPVVSHSFSWTQLTRCPSVCH